MKRKTNIFAWVVAVVVVIVIIAGAWYLRHARQAPVARTPAVAASAPPAAAKSAIEHPIARASSSPAVATSAPLPSLADSDGQVTAALARLGGDAAVGKLLVNRHVIERIVATIDALPRRELGDNILPLQPPAGDFGTATATDGQVVVASSNYARYAPYMQWVRQADVSALVAWYVHYYPLFQQAYRQLGYPHGYFNDRLVAVIDHLLKAPVPAGPVALVKTDKGFAFADSRLEALSAGQKLMLHVGPANEKLIKDKLRAIRAAVTGGNGPAGAASASR